MKKIKKLLFVGLFPILAFTMSSCTDYQDEIDQLDVRVTNLENLVKQANNELISIKGIVDAFKSGDIITDIQETSEGYIIVFANGDPIFIRNGVDGKMPNIIVKKDPTDNNYYWYLVDDNGKETPITDTEGNKVKANGSDGKTPDLRINSDGYWEVSYDGINYTSLGVKATGENGEDANRVTQVIVN